MPADRSAPREERTAQDDLSPSLDNLNADQQRQAQILNTRLALQREGRIAEEQPPVPPWLNDFITNNWNALRQMGATIGMHPTERERELLSPNTQAVLRGADTLGYQLAMMPLAMLAAPESELQKLMQGVLDEAQMAHMKPMSHYLGEFFERFHRGQLSNEAGNVLGRAMGSAEGAEPPPSPPPDTIPPPGSRERQALLDYIRAQHGNRPVPQPPQVPISR